jgi:hypothetical protein
MTPYLFLTNYFVKNEHNITNTTKPINPPLTSVSKRVVIFATTSNPRTEVPVNTNHKIANGISPINTLTKLETKPFTILNTESILFLFFVCFAALLPNVD